MGGRSGEKSVRNRKTAYADDETWTEEKNGTKIIRMRVVHKKRKRKGKKK